MHEWRATALSAAAVLAAAGLLFIDPGTSEYVRPQGAMPPPQATILFGGDMMFDRSVRAVMEEQGDDFVLSCIADALRSPDAVVANLEGTITHFPSRSIGTAPGDPHNTTFTFATTTASLLARHNIRIVNLGNNHIADLGREGIIETKANLHAAGVAYFGDPEATESDRVLRVMIRGVPLSFVNWSDWTSDKTDHTVAQIAAEAAAGRVAVVYTHWGEEYVPPIPRVKQLARSFVDAGAAIVIGSHPHIVQEREEYAGRYIYYSLGNFVFDQYFSPEVQRGLMLKVVFAPTGVMHVEEIPIRMTPDRRTCVE